MRKTIIALITIAVLVASTATANASTSAETAGHQTGTTSVTSE